ncbi:MAG: TetR/AcrR family transcriptional regulator [Anaerolineae bacterium]|nr:TetR/AcrR family transcriptional regulator [Anaerolineae bacterium]
MSEEPTRREQQKEARRKQILKSALATFSEKGFNAANVSDVAARAGVSQGTIYWYFESKEELLMQALLSIFDEMGEGALDAVMQCETAADKVRALGRIMVGVMAQIEGVFPLFMEYWASSARREEVGEIWGSILVEYKDLIVGIIEQGIRRGEFRPVDADRLVWAMLAAYDGLAAYDMFLPALDLAQISETFIETLLTGLIVQQPPGHAPGQSVAGTERESEQLEG